jgi:hypothetical protein
MYSDQINERVWDREMGNSGKIITWTHLFNRLSGMYPLNLCPGNNIATLSFDEFYKSATWK